MPCTTVVSGSRPPATSAPGPSAACAISLTSLQYRSEIVKVVNNIYPNEQACVPPVHVSCGPPLVESTDVEATGHRREHAPRARGGPRGALGHLAGPCARRLRRRGRRPARLAAADLRRTPPDDRPHHRPA